MTTITGSRTGARALAVGLATAAALALSAGPARAACLADAEVAALFDAHLAKTPAATPKDLSPADGECTRAKLNRLLESRYGAPVGYKAGLTNPAIRKRFNHDSPVWGVLYGPMLLDDGAVVDPAFGARPQFEADLMVRVASDAINRARTPDEVMAAIDQVIPFIELPDLVVAAPPQLNGAAVGAINVGARLGVRGTPLPVPGAADERRRLLDALREMVVVIEVDGAEADRGRGSDVLDHPLNAVVWLVQDLARHDRRLKVGDVVSLGSFSKLLPPKPGTAVAVEYRGLPGTPRVAMRFR